MLVGATDSGICLFDFEHRKMMPSIKARIRKSLGMDFQDGEHEYHGLLQKQLNEYFSGERKVFDLPLCYTGTDFQAKVWNELLSIPYGSTKTYMDLTKKLGDVNAIRAVARANGENCLAIIVPCHRVIGSNGDLTGYAGGLRNKKWLLEHEAKHAGTAYQEELF
ncbi:MAG: methylated-DNA--[protein]-cysteine S-methyltransferase [Chitinophagaceae bacterium]|nr:methylated-DNA--[protein]-cysteine S-methyltransferase [Chitinophagaceae bacterium]